MMRVGIGYDIHRTMHGSYVTLGGVRIPASFSLEGHSDADVLLHALMDALLGAAALGDIGLHFPPTDENYREISSLQLLADVERIVREAGYVVVNADIMVIAEEPHIRSHAATMVSLIARALHCDESAISVKATTNEGVGPEGRMEAISAQAVALVDRST